MDFKKSYEEVVDYEKETEVNEECASLLKNVNIASSVNVTLTAFKNKENAGKL